MTTVTVETQVAAQVAQVFGVFTDIEHGAEHVSNIKKIELLTPGGFALGARCGDTRVWPPRLGEMEVTAFEGTSTLQHPSQGLRGSMRCSLRASRWRTKLRTPSPAVTDFLRFSAPLMWASAASADGSARPRRPQALLVIAVC